MVSGPRIPAPRRGEKPVKIWVAKRFHLPQSAPVGTTGRCPGPVFPNTSRVDAHLPCRALEAFSSESIRSKRRTVLTCPLSADMRVPRSHGPHHRFTRTPIPILMAGHNKWSKVKHIKARVDAIKGRVFSKCAHEIALAARAGGGDPAANARLRTAIDNAKAVSMPKDNIDRAVKKGTGELGGDMIQEISYEGYGPAGIAFIIEMATDNLNRVAADIRLIFSKNGGSVATPGSVSYQFDRKGEIRINAADIPEDKIMDAAIEAGADDVHSDAEEHVILTAPNELGTVANTLRAAGLNLVS